MRPRVYIETTIPSFYYEDRPEAFAVARREWTRTWWDKRSHLYDLISSQAVLDELIVSIWQMQISLTISAISIRS